MTADIFSAAIEMLTSKAGAFMSWWASVFHHADAYVALFTFVLAVSTIALWWSTRRLWKATDFSVDLAQKEFIASHRPRVIVRFIQGPFVDEENGAMRQFVWITVVNVGDSKATIQLIGADLARKLALRGTNDPEWVVPGLDAAPKPVTPVVLISGQRHTFKVSAKIPFTDKEIFADAQDAHELCAVGAIRYSDDNGAVRETGFYRTFKERQGFVPSQNIEDEYQD
jgi:hypothetical protein